MHEVRIHPPALPGHGLLIPRAVQRPAEAHAGIDDDKRADVRGGRGVSADPRTVQEHSLQNVTCDLTGAGDERHRVAVGSTAASRRQLPYAIFVE